MNQPTAGKRLQDIYGDVSWWNRSSVFSTHARTEQTNLQGWTWWRVTRWCTLDIWTAHAVVWGRRWTHSQWCLCPPLFFPGLKIQTHLQNVLECQHTVAFEEKGWGRLVKAVVGGLRLSIPRLQSPNVCGQQKWEIPTESGNSTRSSA